MVSWSVSFPQNSPQKLIGIMSIIQQTGVPDSVKTVNTREDTVKIQERRGEASCSQKKKSMAD